MKLKSFTVTVHQENKFFVADCFEVGTVSQGTTIEEAIQNVKEATELYLEEFPNEKMESNEKYKYPEWHFIEIAKDQRNIKNQLKEKISYI